jgi:SAM-dependent methyltransferase
MNATEQLFRIYYSSRADFVGGTAEFHGIVRRHCPPAATILEIGAGPSNPTSDFLATLGIVDGLDISEEVTGNRALRTARVFDGRKFPLPDSTYDLCVSNYVLEHVEDPTVHFAEVARVLKSLGAYVFRTPNLWHYVAIVSNLLPHRLHQRLSPNLRATHAETYPTFYKANRARQLRRLCSNTNLIPSLKMVEKEPSYGRISPVLFYPMMAYERIVNRFTPLSYFRANIFGVAIRSTSGVELIASSPGCRC